MTRYDYSPDPLEGTASPAGGGTDADQLKDQVAGQVREKAQVAKDRARAATWQARGRLREQVDQRSTQAGERVSGTAGDVRSVAEELRRQGKDVPARLADQAADRADHVGRYLKAADADRLLADVEDFARKRPWAVAAGGLALGFAASRLLKASSSQRYRSYQDGATYPGDATGTAAAYTAGPDPTAATHAPVDTRRRPADPEPLT